MLKNELLEQLKKGTMTTDSEEINIDAVLAEWEQNKKAKRFTVPNQIAKPPFSIQFILENGIENFIEKGCIEACQNLWKLNIFTFESSNNQSYPSAWIDLLSLSKENQQVFNELKIQGKAGINPYTNCYCLLAPIGPEAEPFFLESISKFHLQDIPKELYQSGEAYLDCAKRIGGKTTINEDGTISRNINPKLINLTLEEALALDNKSNLYDKESNRVFLDEYTYQRYREYIKTKNQTL